MVSKRKDIKKFKYAFASGMLFILIFIEPHNWYIYVPLLAHMVYYYFN